LSHLILPTAALTTIERDAIEATSLTNIDLSATNLTTISSAAFARNAHLSTLILPNTLTNVSHDIIMYCPELNQLEIAEGGAYYSEDNSIIKQADMSLIAGNNEGTIPSGVKKLGRRAFRGRDIESIIIPNTVTYITSEITSTGTDYSTFFDCDTLKNIYVQHEKGVIANAPWGAKNAYIMYEALDKSAVLDEASIDATNKDNILDKKITEDINAVISRLLDVENILFGGSEGLTYSTNASGTVTLTAADNTYSNLIIAAKYNGNKVTVIDKNVFKNNTNLNSITMPGTITKVSADAFNGTTNLKTFIFNGSLADYCKISFDGSQSIPMRHTKAIIIDGKDVTEIDSSITNIANYNFAYCNTLIKADLSNVTSWGTQLFNQATNLAEVSLPTSSSINEIKSYQFAATALAEITIPANITTIGTLAFSGCSNLKTVTLESATPPALIPHSTTHALPFTVICTFKVPAGTKTTYESAAGWSDLKAKGFTFEEVSE
jgi:hypothetical protein